MAEVGLPASPARSSALLRFGLRELLLITVIVGLALAWCLDRRQDQARLALAELQIHELQRERGLIQPIINGRVARHEFESQITCPFDTPDAYVAFLAQPNGYWGELTHNAIGARKPPLGEDAAPAVAALLSDRDPRIRARAAIALGYMQAKVDAVVPALIALLEHPSSEVRYLAVNALGELRSGAKPAIPALKDVLHDDDSELAALAGWAICMVDPQEQLGPRFKQLLTNKHQKNRLFAIRELRYHLPPHDAEQALVEAFALEKDPGVRQQIARALNRLP